MVEYIVSIVVTFREFSIIEEIIKNYLALFIN